LYTDGGKDFNSEHLEQVANELRIVLCQRRYPGEGGYREAAGKDVFLSRAHASGLETEMLSYAEAQAMSRRLRKAGKSISNESMFNEVRLRDREVEEHQQRKRKRGKGKEGANVSEAIERGETEEEAKKVVQARCDEISMAGFAECGYEMGCETIVSRPISYPHSAKRNG